ncbi:glutamate--cysteine ligase catalytic subunit-like [Octopus sinensis]|uniref:Glutamate--cysteine ligase n=1 Tax=Octopus sinensis TaxID=2607531 RepID=A0A7E6EJF7_9MOLL|nr:glutamate--cysteine ligase catalytic subunit-like [Octopus sinensis]
MPKYITGTLVSINICMKVTQYNQLLKGIDGIRFVQLTDFENAAFVVFMLLLTRTIVTFKLNLLILITKVDENFPPAQKPDAINKEKFHFRKDVQKESSELTQDIYSLMTLNEIMNGKDDFPGLIPLIHKYLDYIDYDFSKRPKIMQYLKYISDKLQER